MSGPIGSSHWMYASGGFYPYLIDQSLRFNAASESELSRTFAAGNRRKWTFSTWMKRSELTPSGNDDYIFGTNTGAANSTFMFLNWRAGDDLIVTGQSTLWLRSDRVFRDVSGWYHIVWSLDTDNATASQRMRLYVNGTELTSFSTDSRSSLTGDQAINAAVEHNIGRHPTATGYGLGAYLAETHFIDGTALDPTSFGETINGIWVPKNVSGLTYGTNGFYLSFADSSAIGDDLSGNTNDFTANNLAASDVVPDSPTNNFCTLNPLAYSTLGTLSEGNLKIATSTNNRGIHGTMPIPTSGKWYWELHVDSYASGGGVYVGFGADASLGYDEVAQSKGVFMSTYNQAVDVNGSTQSSPYNSQGNNSTSNGDIYSFALDVDNQKFYVAKNGTYRGSSDPSAGTGGLDVSAVFTNAVTELTVCLTRGGSYNETYSVNFGQDSKDVASANADENGFGTFEYAVPNGFLCLCSQNLPEPTIGPNSAEQADDYFNTVLYTGDGTNGQAITGVGHQPNFLWIKSRSGTAYHELHDSVRGAGKRLFSNDTAAESDVGTVSSFDSDGFTVSRNSAYDGTNQNGVSFVGWNWKAGGTAVSNTDGSITSSVSAAPDAGFSIVSWSATNTDNQTIGHGLNATPELIISKSRNTAGTDWWVWAASESGKYGRLNNTGAWVSDTSIWYTAGMSSTTFGVRSLGNNYSSRTYVAYCFHSVPGYQAIGSYVGNGSANGTYVALNFKPSFVLLKSTTVADHWRIYDNKRNGNNPDTKFIYPNLSNAEAAASGSLDFLSNGFKTRVTDPAINGSGQTYIYLAFAEAPFKYSNAR